MTARGRGWRRGLQRAEGKEPDRWRRWRWILGTAVLLWAAVQVTGPGLVRHRVYPLGYPVGGRAAVVESWSLRLPLGARLVWWRSDPPGPSDGLRFFWPQ